jgi:carotenoid cleavage dioxygenase
MASPDSDPSLFPPSESPYLEGGYAPIQTEITARDLPVAGTLPDDLAGVFVRTGSNPRVHPIGHYHFFDGDGMLHAVHFEGGAATYRNRYVRTEGLAAEEAAGRALYTGILEPPDLRRPGGPYKDTGNTDLVFHAGQLLALWWLSGKARVIRLPDLETLGNQDWDGKLFRSISAHPKVDPRTGEMIFFDYSPRPPYLTHGVVSPAGELLHQAPIELAGPRSQHDTAITEHYTLLFDMSMRGDAKQRARGKMPLKMERDEPARIGVVPRFGTNEDVRWFEVAPFFMYHVINAWEEGEKIVLLGCRIADPVEGDPRNPRADRQVPVLGNLRLSPAFHRWTLDLATGEATEEVLDDVLTEFPRMNDARLGQRSRYSYHPRLAEAPTLLFDALIRYDLETGGSAVHEYPRGWYGGEVSFAARVGGSGAEDDGYLTTFVQEETTGRSELFVIDAAAVAAPPIARIQIPQRVPTGYHTRWVPADELPRQRGR